jgi:hypothetical protein
MNTMSCWRLGVLLLAAGLALMSVQALARPGNGGGSNGGCQAGGNNGGGGGERPPPDYELHLLPCLEGQLSGEARAMKGKDKFDVVRTDTSVLWTPNPDGSWSVSALDPNAIRRRGRGINNLLPVEVVGSGALYWVEAEGPTDLNDRIAPGSGSWLFTADGIDDLGWIVGYAADDGAGVSPGFLLLSLNQLHGVGPRGRAWPDTRGLFPENVQVAAPQTARWQRAGPESSLTRACRLL